MIEKDQKFASEQIRAIAQTTVQKFSFNLLSKDEAEPIVKSVLEINKTIEKLGDAKMLIDVENVKPYVNISLKATAHQLNLVVKNLAILYRQALAKERAKYLDQLNSINISHETK